MGKIALTRNPAASPGESYTYPEISDTPPKKILEITLT